MDLFARSGSVSRAAVVEPTGEDFAEPSGNRLSPKVATRVVVIAGFVVARDTVPRSRIVGDDGSAVSTEYGFRWEVDRQRVLSDVADFSRGCTLCRANALVVLELHGCMSESFDIAMNEVVTRVANDPCSVPDNILYRHFDTVTMDFIRSADGSYREVVFEFGRVEEWASSSSTAAILPHPRSRDLAGWLAGAQ